MTPQLSHAIARADRGADQLQRMARLQAMSAAELSATLGGDPVMAAPWVAAAAACGMAAAQLQLGRMLLEGTGLPKDQAAALRWFGKAAMAGNGSAQNRGSAKHRAEAQNMLGRCHELGWGTAVDWTAAVGWYRRAATVSEGGGGDGWGIYNLANMLFDGRGIAEDRAAAVVLYRRAARLGHARAMNLLGRCLEEGWGTPRDPAGAAQWYRRSAEGAYFRGQYNHGVELLRQGHRAEAAAMFERATPEADAAMRARMADLLG
jgi:TPR repeat protein